MQKVDYVQIPFPTKKKACLRKYEIIDLKQENVLDEHIVTGFQMLQRKI